MLAEPIDALIVILWRVNPGMISQDADSLRATFPTMSTDGFIKYLIPYGFDEEKLSTYAKELEVHHTKKKDHLIGMMIDGRSRKRFMKGGK